MFHFKTIAPAPAGSATRSPLRYSNQSGKHRNYIFTNRRFPSMLHPVFPESGNRYEARGASPEFQAVRAGATDRRTEPHSMKRTSISPRKAAISRQLADTEHQRIPTGKSLHLDVPLASRTHIRTRFTAGGAPLTTAGAPTLNPVKRDGLLYGCSNGTERSNEYVKHFRLTLPGILPQECACTVQPVEITRYI